jgi:hypothetical protein
VMFDWQQNFGLHAEIIFHQQFVRLRDGARQRVFDRQHAVGRFAALDRFENVGKRFAWQCGNVFAKLAANRFFAVRTVCALKSYNPFVQLVAPVMIKAIPENNSPV